MGQTHEVVVAGGGMSGMCAALSAAESGANVRLLEKGEVPGGSFMLSGGLLWTYASMAAVGQLMPHGDSTLQEQVLTGIDDARVWLAGHGVEIGRPVSMPHGGRGYELAPSQAVPALRAAMGRMDVRVDVGTSLSGLRVESGAVTGVEVLRVDSLRAETLTCDAAVLATGGFQGNPELIVRYLGVPPESIQLRANRWSTGDGLLAALEAGASTTPGLTHFYGHALAAPPATFSPTQFRDASQYYGSSALALNLAGERFVDEAGGSGEEHVNEALARQTSGMGFYVVDARIAGGEILLGMKGQVIIDRAIALGAPHAVSDTLWGLCEQLEQFGVSATRALSTIRQFNDLVREGRRGHLYPPRTDDCAPLDCPPFQAIGVQAAITFTMGGIAVDERMRVLGRSQGSSLINGAVSDLGDMREAPIPGLLAAGCDVGGLHYGGYMGGLACAAVTGRIAGLSAGGAPPPPAAAGRAI
jgi:succinate dehydrogenase/fumarate reductase flavoprotein subunit